MNDNYESANLLLSDKFSGIFPGWGCPQILAVELNADGKYEVVGDTNLDATKGMKSPLPKKDAEDIVKSIDNEGKTGNPEFKDAQGLSVLQSVSIAGCDLLGSCLYTAGVCTVNSGLVSNRCTIVLFGFSVTSYPTLDIPVTLD